MRQKSENNTSFSGLEVRYDHYHWIKKKKLDLMTCLTHNSMAHSFKRGLSYVLSLWASLKRSLRSGFSAKKDNFFIFFLLIHEIIFTHVHRLSICSLDTMATFRSNYRIFRAILRPIKIPRQNGHKKKRVFCQFCKFQSMLVLPGVD